MKGKTLADISTGPDWLLSVVIALFAVLSVLFLLGKGSWLIAGYNTASEKEKQQYNKTRLCRVCGGGMAFITVLLLIMEKYEDVLPASIAHIFAIAVFADCIVMCVLGNTICRKK
ncbi:MAG: DUF3784 domain-containing protein [Dorea sp.]|nr:DUF3784 domain-containing protein [Dorea sp.]